MWDKGGNKKTSTFVNVLGSRAPLKSNLPRAFYIFKDLEGKWFIEKWFPKKRGNGLLLSFAKDSMLLFIQIC